MALKLLALLLVVVVAEERVSYRNHKLLQVAVRNIEESDKISELENNGLDVWSSAIGEAAYVHVAPWDLAQVSETLTELGLAFNIVNEDLQENIDRERELIAEADAKRGRASWVGRSFVRYSEIVSWIQSLPSTYRGKVAVQSIGKSYENRDIYLIRLSDNIAQSGNRKVIFLESNIHAREWLSHATIALFIETLLVEYGTNSKITAALRNYEWHFVVVSNPDGYEYTHVTDRNWRKTRTRYGTCFGADPNRNFDSHHCGEGTSTNPCNYQTYCGPRPFSEKETEALSNYLISIKNKLKVFQSVHTYGQYVLLPFAYTRRAYPSDFNELLRVSNAMTDSIQRTSGQYYRAGNVADMLGPAAGSTMDWVREALGTQYVLAWELRPINGTANGFEASPSQIVPTTNEFLAAQLTLLDTVRA